MPRIAKQLPIPTTFEMVGGEMLVKAKAAAKLAGVHPVAMEIVRKLQGEPSKGAVFVLGDKAMKEKALEIERALVSDLRKIVRAWGLGFKAKSTREGDRLLFWFDSKA